jgi:hypothetical protein
VSKEALLLATDMVPVSHLPNLALVAGVPDQEGDAGKKTLVLDLDETLVHSSFKPIPAPDYIIPVEIEGRIVDVYVLKRPWLDHFMAAIAGRFEARAQGVLCLLRVSKVFPSCCCPAAGMWARV